MVGQSPRHSRQRLRAMTPEERQKALDEISADDLAKVKQHQASTNTTYSVDAEWMLFAEFAIKFGWDAYRAARADEIPTDEMMTLLEASRKLDSLNQLYTAQAVFAGAGSAQSKKPAQTFKSLTKNMIKNMKVDE